MSFVDYRRRLMSWLLCDFHIHTCWSDGKLTINEVVDLYGENGFDVISITDHIIDEKSRKKYLDKNSRIPSITKDSFNDYQKELWNAATDAWNKYKMLLIPGIEITNDTEKFHMLNIDLKAYIDPDLTVEEIITQIHSTGGIAIACHPYTRGHTNDLQSIHLWENHEKYAKLFDAWEVANRDDLFNVIGLKKFNYIANSDFHELRHLYSWKTLLLCEKNVEAVKGAIRQNTGVAIYLHRK